MDGRISLLLAMLSVCVCVSAKPRPLPIPVAQELPVEIVLTQNELAVDVPETANSMQLGLLGALIGTAVQNSLVKKVEARVAPTRDLLIDYNFAERIEAALREKMASEGLSPQPVIRVMQTSWDAAEAVQNPQDLPLHAMVIRPRYSLDAGFGELKVTLMTQVVDRTIGPNGKVRTTQRFGRSYEQGFGRFYTFRFLQPSAFKGDRAQFWTAMGPDALAELIDQGIDQATDMLVYDFSVEGRTQWDQKINRQKTVLKGRTFTGRPVRQSEDWVWVRSSASLQGYQPLTASDPSASAPAEGDSPSPDADEATAAAPADAHSAAQPRGDG